MPKEKKEKKEKIENNQDSDDDELIDPFAFWRILLSSRAIALVLIALAAYLVYEPGLDGQFILDSRYCIEKNPTIQDLSDIPAIWRTPANGCTTMGRPLLNLSFAINMYFSDNDPHAYQVTNLVIHILVAFVLYGLLRGTLRLHVIPPPYIVYIIKACSSISTPSHIGQIEYQ